jgi:hypothetical protein
LKGLKAAAFVHATRVGLALCTAPELDVNSGVSPGVPAGTGAGMQKRGLLRVTCFGSNSLSWLTDLFISGSVENWNRVKPVQPITGK